MYSIANQDCLVEMKAMADNSIDLILTDPPYGVNFKNDFYEDSADLVEQLIPVWYKEMYRILKQDCYVVLYVGLRNLNIWIDEAIKAGFTFKNIVATRCFNNGTPTPKNNFGFQFQPVLVLSKGKGKDFNEVDFIPTSEGWFKDKRNKNPKPYTYAYPNWIKTEWGFATTKRASKNLHPNEKNTTLLKFFIEVLTDKDDVVLDCFMGCGSTGIAAIQASRDFIGIELDQHYFEVSQERLKYAESNKEI